ncbi:unnamed protein product [Aphis gossypii]|uniref:Uncharacterized protein n=1 Tax=Aphis gossypii TaxID=80765 RepID=A0A9P0IT84_APHGO|nr:unnamed protein product [Aphis gossypii]
MIMDNDEDDNNNNNNNRGCDNIDYNNNNVATHNSDNGYVVTAISARQPPPAARPSPSLVFILYTHTASLFRTFATVPQRAPTVLRTSRLNSKSRFLFTLKTTVALSLFTIIKTTCNQIYYLFLFFIHYLLPTSLVIRST